MTRIDITKPLEAVRKSDGKVVPMTYKGPAGTINPDMFLTTTAPSDTSNPYWRYDGTDPCNNDWSIRNVVVQHQNLDLTLPMQMRDGAAVTLLSDKAQGDNPLVFQHADGAIFSRPRHGRCFADGVDMSSDVVNKDVDTKQQVRINLHSDYAGIGSLKNNPSNSILINLLRTNGKVTGVEFISAGDRA